MTYVCTNPACVMYHRGDLFIQETCPGCQEKMEPVEDA